MSTIGARFGPTVWFELWLVASTELSSPLFGSWLGWFLVSVAYLFSLSWEASRLLTPAGRLQGPELTPIW